MGERLPPLLRPAPVLTTRGKRGGRASPFPLCPPVRRGQIPHVPVKASLIGRRITCRTPSPACALNTSGLRGAYHHGDRSPAGPHAQGSPRYTRLGSPRVPARPSGRAYRSSLPGCRNRRRPRPPPRPELRGGMLVPGPAHPPRSGSRQYTAHDQYRGQCDNRDLPVLHSLPPRWFRPPSGHGQSVRCRWRGCGRVVAWERRSVGRLGGVLGGKTEGQCVQASYGIWRRVPSIRVRSSRSRWSCARSSLSRARETRVP